ncbi:hypothetical protein HSX11_09385 [Oxalobacteraceae bacterium]|nr:hypothetical protein [Oxalobacteraceae bacterium]
MSDSTLQALRHMNQRSEQASEQMADFNRRQTEGERPDPNEFTALLEQRSVTHDAMAAQFKLFDKPLRTVLQETK